MSSGVAFRTTPAGDLEIQDTVSDQQYRLTAAAPLDPQPTANGDFPAPVTAAVSVDSQDVRLSDPYSGTLRDETGDVEAILDLGSTVERKQGEYFLEFNAPVKTYLRVEAPFEYTHTREGITVEFGRQARSVVGAREWRCLPQETVTVPDSPRALADALSYVGTTLQTTSSERSFPTLRGHPPEFVQGDALDIPPTLSKPESDVTITVPPTWSAVLSVAPLAYYLAATVETDEVFAVRTANGFSYEPPEDEIAEAASTVLQHCFTLDCLVRTEGLYPFDLHERAVFEAAGGDLDYERLYDLPLARRTEEYLSVDPGPVAEVTPQWPVTAVVEPGSAAVPALPYLLYELALVQPANPPRHTGDAARTRALAAFSQGARETRSTSLVFDEEAEFVDVPETGSQQTLWIGDGVPLNAAAFQVEGYRNTPALTEESGLTVTVVCNEPTMADEPETITAALDPRDDLSAEITTHRRVSTATLRQIIERGTDYLHFVGHATPDGLECTDGPLDVTTVAESNVETFFLNACQSFHQGRRLVERGSMGGIVTYSDISNEHALRVGGFAARLLDDGFPVGACLDIVRETTPIGGQYTVVGNHAATLAKAEGGGPYINTITPIEDGYELEIQSYTAGASRTSVGTVIAYAVDPATRQYLLPSAVTFDVKQEELEAFLSHGEKPVVTDGRLQSQAEFIEEQFE